MTPKITETSRAVREYLTVEQAAGTKYKLRTECRFDCQHIIAILRPWVLSWKEASGYQHDDSYVDDDGVIWSSQNWGLDVDVQFIIRPGGPSLNEMQWLFRMLIDCHVAAESVNASEKYTGERIGYEQLEKVAIQPKPPMLEAAMEGLAFRRDVNESSVDILEEAIESLDKALRETRSQSGAGTQSMPSASRSGAPSAPSTPTLVKPASRGKKKNREAATQALQHANSKLVCKAHGLLNSRNFHFIRHDKVSGTYLMIQTWINGISSRVDFGPDRPIAVVVSLDTMLAEAYVYSNAHYHEYEAMDLPVPLYPPLELSLTGGHIAMANRLGKLLAEMHRIHGDKRK